MKCSYFLAACSATLLAASPLHAASFLPLGDIAGGAFSSSATDVSDDGRTVVGVSTGPGERSQAFRFRPETGMVAIGDLAGSSVAAAVSADGSTVVGTAGSAVRWDESNVMTALGPGNAVGVSGDGSVVAVSDHTGGNYLWNAVGSTTPVRDMRMMGLSDDGLLIPGSIGVPDPFDIFEPPEIVPVIIGGGPLEDIPHSNEVAVAVSADGSVVVGFDEGPGGTNALIWANGTQSNLIGLPPFFADTRANDVTPDGSVIVGTSSIGPSSDAIFWDASGTHLISDLAIAVGIDLTGWDLRTATGVSADGKTFVGTGVNPQGNSEAWLLRVPEPSTGWMVALALGAAVRVRRSR